MYNKWRVCGYTHVIVNIVSDYIIYATNNRVVGKDTETACEASISFFSDIRYTTQVSNTCPSFWLMWFLQNSHLLNMKTVNTGNLNLVTCVCNRSLYLLCMSVKHITPFCTFKHKNPKKRTRFIYVIHTKRAAPKKAQCKYATQPNSLGHNPSSKDFLLFFFSNEGHLSQN